MRRTALAVLLAVLLAAFASSGAMAHAVLVASEPADGAILAAPPARLTLTFNEPVAPLVLRLIRPDGTEQAAAVKQAGATLEVSPSGEIRDGTHLLSWRVVSADGHPIGGTVVFSVGHASEGGGPSLERAPGVALTAIWVARVATYIAMFVGVGGVFFVVWVAAGPPYPAGRFLHTLLLVGLVAAPVSLGLQGVDLLSVPLTYLATSAVWQAGLRSSYAMTAAAAFVSFFVAWVALAVSSRRTARIAASIAFVGVGLALAASGHASAAEPQFLMRSAVFVHALSIAFWMGALLPLAASRPDRSQGPRTALRRLSRVVPFVLAALLASGAVLAWVQVGEVPALWRTDYGRLLLAKLGLFALLLAVALYNRFAPRGRASIDEPAASRAFVRTMRIEIALALAIFAVTAGWRFAPPPRALASLAAMPATLHVHSQAILADVRFDPGRAGPTTASIVVMTGEYGPLDAREVRLALSKEDSGIEPVRRPATRDADGIWRVRGLLVPQPGRWTVRIDVLVSDFEKVTLEDAVEFRP
ncbi:MAG TPA: copper resistance protein CopC [Xanthobacteraceae bacterium]|nr:copper resistance protein CopC [Xanthobacteraceae bacterium]